MKTKKIVNSKDKILLVTEFISTAESISQVIRILKKADLNYDVATLSASIIAHIKLGNPKEYDCPELEGIKNYSGKKAELFFYKRLGISGVEKHGRQVLSKRREATKKEKDIFLAARRDTKKMIDYLKKIYDKEKEKLEK